MHIYLHVQEHSNTYPGLYGKVEVVKVQTDNIIWKTTQFTCRLTSQAVFLFSNSHVVTNT